jgi:hypothetical protein
MSSHTETRANRAQDRQPRIARWEVEQRRELASLRSRSAAQVRGPEYTVPVTQRFLHPACLSRCARFSRQNMRSPLSHDFDANVYEILSCTRYVKVVHALGEYLRVRKKATAGVMTNGPGQIAHYAYRNRIPYCFQRYCLNLICDALRAPSQSCMWLTW